MQKVPAAHTVLPQGPFIAFYRRLGAVHREGDAHLEQIAVHLDRKRAAARLDIAFGDRQTEAAALGRARRVAAHKALGDLTRVKIHGVIGDVLELDDRLSFPLGRRDEHARARQRIFDAVADQVLHHAGHLLAVRPDGQLALGDIDLERQAALRDRLVLLAQRLPHERAGVDALALHLLRARLHLGDVEQVARQVFEPQALLVDYLRVVVGLLRGQMLLTEQIGVGSKWRSAGS